MKIFSPCPGQSSPDFDGGGGAIACCVIMSLIFIKRNLVLVVLVIWAAVYSNKLHFNFECDAFKGAGSI